MSSYNENLEVNQDDVRKFYKLIQKPGDLREVRQPGGAAGYFDNEDKFVECIVDDNNQYAKNQYMTLNPVNREIIEPICKEGRIVIVKGKDVVDKRAMNGTIRARFTTDDDQTLRWETIFFDIDAKCMVDGVKTSGVSATAEEHHKTRETAQDIIKFMKKMGCPEPLYMTSGNGCYLVYRVDLPHGASAVEYLLKAVATRWNNVDTGVFNDSRIFKIAGTVARKGDNTPERPHRLAKIISAPDVLEVLTLEQMKKVMKALSTDVLAEYLTGKTFVKPSTKEASEKEASVKILPVVKSGKNTKESMEALFKEMNIKSDLIDECEKDGTAKWNFMCPYADEHGSATNLVDAAAWLNENGKITVKCSHSTCINAGRTEARDFFGDDINGEATLQKNLDNLVHKKKSEEEVDKQEMFESEHKGKPVYTQKKDSDDDGDKFKKCANHWLDATAHLHPIYNNDSIWYYTGNKYERISDKSFRLDLVAFCDKWNYTTVHNVINNIITLIQSRLRKEGDMPFWDGDCPFKSQNNIIAFNNGLIDISSDDLVLHPHTPDWVSSYSLPYDYDPTAKCPLWMKFLNSVFAEGNDRELLLQQFMGLTLTSDTSFQKVLVLVGKQRSGKGTILRTWTQLAGEPNVCNPTIDSMVSPFGLGPLVGKSIAMVGDADVSQNLKNKANELIKGISGEDRMQINYKNVKEMPSVRLTTRLVIAANQTPRLLDPSGALANRLLFIPFDQSFLYSVDNELEGKLLTELSGIANWAIAGLIKLKKDKRFTTGSFHQEAFDEFQKDTTPLIAFIKETLFVNQYCNPGDIPPDCITVDKCEVSKNDLFLAYTQWCDENEQTPFKSTFFRNLRAFFLRVKEVKKNVNGARVKYFEGIKLRQPTVDEVMGH